MLIRGLDVLQPTSKYLYLSHQQKKKSASSFAESIHYWHLALWYSSNTIKAGNGDEALTTSQQLL